ncbi:unnamed protein product [Cladocopium goreaui]|uniref:Fe2OG dioxygenase domain-containing protein n=1 Tax=Cladocopium goreaui TaxID=2562237 RepID=A0A9P1CYR3_9DINO|nr:unnamed protein product [Cladocopium goreaui]
MLSGLSVERTCFICLRGRLSSLSTSSAHGRFAESKRGRRAQTAWHSTGLASSVGSVVVSGCLLASERRSVRSWSRRTSCPGRQRSPIATFASQVTYETVQKAKCDAPEESAGSSILRPLPEKIRNEIGRFDRGRHANPDALENDAFYLPGLNCSPDDMSVFDRLMIELDFKDCWLETGMKFSRQICIGDEHTLATAPTYRALVERVSKVFGVRVVRTLVNLYRDGTDWCNLHSDQYHQGGYPIDLTVGATFGDPRRLVWVEKSNTRHKIELPQLNGDVFAFSDKINSTWRHMIPQEGPDCGPRISVIVWCDRHKSTADWMGALGSFPHMLHHNPKKNGNDYEAQPGSRPRRRRAAPSMGPIRPQRLQSLEDDELEEAVDSAQKALTLQGAQQVFAILRGIKLIENRTWAIPKGWYALHAGAQMINDERAKRTLEAWPEAPPEEELPHRAIAGLIYIDQIRKPQECKRGYIWARGPICNVISRAVELPRPVRCRGDRGLWELGTLKDRIRSELARAGKNVSVRHFDLTPALGPR